MNGFLDYLPFIADCERGMGEPKKAIETAMSDDAKYLRGESKAEMFLVYAGALGDLELWDKAIEIVHTLGRSKGLAGEYRMRAVQAEQYFLEQAGRSDEAVALDLRMRSNPQPIPTTSEVRQNNAEIHNPSAERSLPAGAA